MSTVSTESTVSTKNESLTVFPSQTQMKAELTKSLGKMKSTISRPTSKDVEGNPYGLGANEQQDIVLGTTPVGSLTNGPTEALANAPTEAFVDPPGNIYADALRSAPSISPPT